MTKLSARPGPAGESSEQDIFSHGGSHKATFAIRRPLISPGSSSSKAKQQAETRIPEEDVKEPHRQFNISPTPPIRAADDPITYARPFVSFLRENPTVYHAVQATKDRLIALTTSSTKSSFTVLSERNHPWDLTPGGSYLVTRNGSSLIAFTVGKYYKPGNGIAIIAGHIDALTAKVKPFPKLNSNGKDGTGFERLGVAPYAGALNKTWWDRDLGIAGRVMLKDRSRGGKVVQRLVDLGDPIARIPTLAPHFGQISQGPYNLETQMVPIVGLETGDSDKALGDEGTFAATQPPRLVRAISKSLGTTDCGIPLRSASTLSRTITDPHAQITASLIGILSFMIPNQPSLVDSTRNLSTGGALMTSSALGLPLKHLLHPTSPVKLSISLHSLTMRKLARCCVKALAPTSFPQLSNVSHKDSQSLALPLRLGKRMPTLLWSQRM